MSAFQGTLFSNTNLLGEFNRPIVYEFKKPFIMVNRIELSQVLRD